MKFKCGKTYKELQVEWKAYEKKFTEHDHYNGYYYIQKGKDFAWLPIKVLPGECLWLEYVSWTRNVYRKWDQFENFCDYSSRTINGSKHYLPAS